MNQPSPLFDRMTALADPVRSRILLLLERHELTVTELKSVMQLPQSTVSRHLKTLADHDWVSSRPEGTSRRYRAVDRLEAPRRKLWQVVREHMLTTPATRHDARRLQMVLAHRRIRSQKFFSSAAARWDTLRRELFGNRADLTGLLGLIDPEWVVADLGCGTGQLAESLSPFVKSVIALDDSPAMLAAARKRLSTMRNVEVRSGRVESLPVGNGSADAALLFLVLHYVAEPEAAFAEAFRILKPGGRLLVVDMMPHDREDLVQEMGHVWRGFSEERINSLFETAGFESGRYHALASDESAQGPTLFSATARRGSSPTRTTAGLEDEAHGETLALIA